MKKYLVVFLLISVSLQTFAQSDRFPIRGEKVPELNLNQNNSPSFNYVAIGIALPIPIPGVSIGHRERLSKSSAIDVRAGFATAIVASGISTRVSFLRYINENNLYFCGGLGLGTAFAIDSSAIYSISPGIGFGKENESSVHEIGITPMSFTTDGFYAWPTMSYSYGFKF